MSISPELLGLLHDAKMHPEDDAPRLILADWLEEHGQPERAEFVRLQCGKPSFDDGVQVLVLLRENYERWCGPASSNLGLDNSRGLLRLGGPLEYCLAEPLPAGLPPDLPAWVEAVSLDSFSTDWLPALTRSPLARELSTLRVRLPRSSAPEWTSEAEHITAIGNWLDLRAIPALPGLTNLAIETPHLGTQGLECLLRADLSRLRYLSLYSSRIGNEGVQSLTEYRQLGPLQTLALSACRLGPRAAELLADWRGLATVKRLMLWNNELGADGVTALAQSPHRDALEDWSLSVPSADPEAEPGSVMGPAGAVGIAMARPFPCLRILDLRDQQIGLVGAQSLAHSLAFPVLEVLQLESNRIGDEGFQALLEAPWMPQITSLSLQGNGLTYRSIHALLKCSRLHPDLFLDFGRMPGLYDSMRRRVKARFGDKVRC